MSSLKALLSVKTLETVKMNPEVDYSNTKKRGAALESLIFKKFPELYEDGGECANNQAKMISATPENENQPLSMPEFNHF